MVATQFSLLNWNHIYLKQREILSRNYIASGVQASNRIFVRARSKRPLFSLFFLDKRGSAHHRMQASLFKAGRRAPTFRTHGQGHVHNAKSAWNPRIYAASLWPFRENRIHFVHVPVLYAGCLRMTGEPMTPFAAAIADSGPCRPSHGHGPHGHLSSDRRIVLPSSSVTRWRRRARRVRRSVKRHPMLLMLGILHVFFASICDAYSLWSNSPRPLRRYHANMSSRSSRRHSSALAALDRTTTTPPPTNIPLSPSTFAGQVEKELLNRFDGTDETIVIIKSNFYANVLAMSYGMFSLCSLSTIGFDLWCWMNVIEIKTTDRAAVSGVYATA